MFNPGLGLPCLFHFCELVAKYLAPTAIISINGLYIPLRILSALSSSISVKLSISKIRIVKDIVAFTPLALDIFPIPSGQFVGVARRHDQQEI